MANLLEEYFEVEEEENDYLIDEDELEIDGYDDGYDLEEGDLLDAGDDLLDHGDDDEDDNLLFDELNEPEEPDLDIEAIAEQMEDFGFLDEPEWTPKGLGSSGGLKDKLGSTESIEAGRDTLQTREDLLSGARGRSKIVDDKEAHDVLSNSSDSYLFANSLDVSGSLGPGASGSVVAAKDLRLLRENVETTSSGLKVITGPESTDNGATYTGDWEKLQTFLDVGVPEGAFDFEFDLRDQIPSIEVLQKEVEVLNEIQDIGQPGLRGEERGEIAEELGFDARSAYSQFRGNEEEFYQLMHRDDFQHILGATTVLRPWSGMQMPDLLSDLEFRGRGIVEEARLVDNLTSMTGKGTMKEEAAEKIYNEDRELLYEVQDRYEASPFLIESMPTIETEIGLSPREFLGTFNGGSSERVLGEGFQSTEVIGGQYEEGVEKLESLARIEGNYQTDIAYDEVIRDVLGAKVASEIDIDRALEAAENSERSVEAILFGDELGKLIGQKMQEDPEEGQEIVEKRDQLKEHLEEQKREKAFEDVIEEEIVDPELKEQAYREVQSSENPELGFLGQEQVRGMLETLADEHLSENSSAYHDAERLSREMDGREISFEVYDKSLENMPYQEDRSLPCTFPGSKHNTSTVFLNYMLDPGTQVGKIKTDKGDGVALMKVVEYEGDDFLYVHSVEADRGDNIASDKDAANAIRDQIEEYAQELSEEGYEIVYDGETREVDLEGVLYSMERHNNGTPGNFQEVLKEDDEYGVERTALDQVGLEHDGFDHNLGSGVQVYEKAV